LEASDSVGRPRQKDSRLALPANKCAVFDWQPCPSIGYLGLRPAAVESRRGQFPLSDCRGAAVAHGEFVASVIVSIMAVGLSLLLD